MEARHDDLIGLVGLQQIDLEARKLRRAFEDLPQRKKIMDARARREAIAEKRGTIDGLKKNASGRLVRINDEEASLSRKAAEIQAAIEQAQGDYRNLEARTKELAGIERRQGVLAEDRAKVEQELAKIADVEAQVVLALEEIDAAEARAIASFQQEGGRLRQQIHDLEQKRAETARTVDPKLVELYEKTAKRAGGVGLGVLKGSQCGACRAAIDGGRLIELKAQAPLGTCPACKRLLVIGE